MSASFFDDAIGNTSDRWVTEGSDSWNEDEQSESYCPCYDERSKWSQGLYNSSKTTHVSGETEGRPSSRYSIACCWLPTGGDDRREMIFWNSFQLVENKDVTVRLLGRAGGVVLIGVVVDTHYGRDVLSIASYLPSVCQWQHPRRGDEAETFFRACMDELARQEQREWGSHS